MAVTTVIAFECDPEACNTYCATTWSLKGECGSVKFTRETAHIMRFLLIFVVLLILVNATFSWPTKSVSDTSSKAGCDLDYCKQECKKRKFTTGRCYNGECICVN
ncbi:unnamed protein product [Bursaphelenchus okinawaensis]|uniref:Knottin scorpion toxin-like domain-containing protein n=1 Tax=Bursaphelenchus okinawaensis TaxID=465554 RepID=A0A811KUF7_9BILA|nr:unnamed protein product [Bursaphelenchus okinawaensis]CAG9112194.1 unnamed protein product [Bursaphelenchus okinawaensis]